MMKKSVCLLLACVSMWTMSPRPGFGQSVRGGQITFDMDHAVFQANKDYAFIEIYMTIPRDAIQHQKGIGGVEGNFETAASLYRGDSLLAEKSRKNTDRAAVPEDVKSSQQLFGIFSFYAKPGAYKLLCRVTDLATQTGGWIEKNIDIPDFPAADVCLSEIQLGMNIEADTSRTLFMKNGYRIIPNPSKMYGIEVPILYYYSEIYNLSSMEPGRDSSYVVAVSILDPQGNPVKTSPDKKKKRLGKSVVDVGSVNVIGLNSGPYEVQVTVKDGATGRTHTRKKDFFLYRRMDYAAKSQAEPKLDQTMSDEYSAMGDKEIDDLFKQCDFIATSKEKKIYKKLDLVGKRKFMQDFWRIRDSNPLTGVNEYKNDYLERMQYVAQHFGNMRKAGWRSDQGRIYLMYGAPDQIERFPSNIDSRPYEIWYFNQVEGGTQCYFVDVQDLGEMRLVHSTIRQELQDADWQRWLTR
jgi:GWxTD domain-containing protein